MSNTADPVYIDDGFSVERYIAAVPRLHGSLAFSFRVLQPPQRAELLADIQGCDELATIERLGAHLENLILKWDAKGRDGKPLPITAANINCLHITMLLRLHRIVCYQSEGGDPAPKQDPPEKRRQMTWMKSAGAEAAEQEKN